MEKLKFVLKSASAVFAILPGVAVLSTSIGVPPGSSEVTYCAILESFGVLTLLLLWFNQDSIISATKKSTNIISFAGIFIFAILLGTYVYLFNSYTFSEGSKSILFPFWQQGELKAGIIRYGNMSSLIANWGIDDVAKIIQTSSVNGYTYTVILFMLIYQLIFISLVFTLGYLGIRIGDLVKSLPNNYHDKVKLLD